MAWALLSIAGILEIAFAFCMKWSEGFTRLIPGLFTVATGLSSVFLLSFSLRTLPVGTGYAVWTGIGAAGTAILGMAVLGDSAAPLRMPCIVLILAGVIGLAGLGNEDDCWSRQAECMEGSGYDPSGTTGHSEAAFLSGNKNADQGNAVAPG
jgi:quaternary ammonium compound-resistance protein SugE